MNLTKLFDTNEFRKKFVAYAKDEGYNLNIITSTLKSTISCDVLGLKENFQRTCIGHPFSKACQYAIIDEKVYKGILKFYLSKLPRRFAKVPNLAKKIQGRANQNGKKMC